VEQQSDPFLKRVVENIQHVNPKQGFNWKQGILLHKGQLVLSASSPLIPHILEEFHASPIGDIRVFYGHISGLMGIYIGLA